MRRRAALALAALALLTPSAATTTEPAVDGAPPRAAAAPDAVAGWWHRRVDVVLYAEALCPYCAAWLADRALEFAHEYGGIAKLHVVPWGNARAAPDGAVACQHGADECLLNTLYACAIADYHHTKWLPLLACASAKHPAVLKAFDKCAARAGVNATSVRACAASRRGGALADAARRETEALYPSHQGVPWFVVERLPVGGATSALGAVACAAWRGQRPAACYRLPPDEDGWSGVAAV